MSTTENIIKQLQFGKNGAIYQFDATKLAGEPASDVLNRLETVESFAASGLTYRGTITAASESSQSGESFNSLGNTSFKPGDILRVVCPTDTTEGYILTAKVELGDMLICNAVYNRDTVEGLDELDYWDIVDTNVDVEAMLDHTHEVEGTVRITVPTAVEESTVDNDVSVKITGYVPEGSIANHNHDVELGVTTTSFDKFESITGTYDESNGGTLTIGVNTTPVDVVTEVTVLTKETPLTFMGTAADMTATVAKSEFKHTHNLDVAEIDGNITGTTGTGTLSAN